MRTVHRSLVIGICVLGLAAAWPARAERAAPRPISPGSADAFTRAASACPTFSWSGVDGAAGYELVVYETPAAAGSDAAPSPAASAEPVLRTRIRGDGHSWTPPADDCLSLAGGYAWSVRALDGSGEGEWSEAALFAVQPVVAAGELAAVLERVLARYLESRGLRYERGGELAGLLAEELAGAAPAVAAQPPAQRRTGRSREAGAPGPRGVFTDEIELWLEESGSSASDKVQLVFATPEFDGVPRDTEADAWAIVVDAEDSGTAGADPGTMSFSAPSFIEPLQLFTDGSAVIGELRELSVRPLSSPPISCTSLQEGMFYWDDDASTLCVCDGSSWAPIDSDNMGSCS